MASSRVLHAISTFGSTFASNSTDIFALSLGEKRLENDDCVGKNFAHENFKIQEPATKQPLKRSNPGSRILRTSLSQET